MKVCRKCNIEKELDKFCSFKTKKVDGSIKINYYDCKICDNRSRSIKRYKKLGKSDEWIELKLSGLIPRKPYFKKVTESSLRKIEEFNVIRDELIRDVSNFILDIKSRDFMVDVNDVMKMDDLVCRIKGRRTYDRESDIDIMFNIIIEFYQLNKKEII